jgi:hypothetical protein
VFHTVSPPKVISSIRLQGISSGFLPLQKQCPGSSKLFTKPDLSHSAVTVRKDAVKILSPQGGSFLSQDNERTFFRRMRCAVSLNEGGKRTRKKEKKEKKKHLTHIGRGGGCQAQRAALFISGLMSVPSSDRMRRLFFSRPRLPAVVHFS